MAQEDMDETDRIRYAGSFGSAVDSYQRGRPGYPDEAVDWLLAPIADRVRPAVCDLGAGTGKLTRSLVSRGLSVSAVEPSAEMLDRLSVEVPEATATLGTAESTGLGDASMDAVLMAQAWHWVDPARAVPEVARVLRDGGTLGLLWNLRTDTTPFARRLEDLIGGSDQHGWQPVDPAGVPGSPFPAAEERTVDWTFSLGSEFIVDMVASRSYVIAMAAGPRAALLAQVAELAHEHARDGVVEVPYQTRCLRYRRADR